MHRNHRKFFIFGLIALFSVYFAYLFYITKYRPLPPKPPYAEFRIPAADSTSVFNTVFYDFDNFKASGLLATTSLSGKYALKVKGQKAFSLLIQKPISELQQKSFTEAGISAWIRSEPGKKISGKLMFQIFDKTNALKYSYAISLEEADRPDNAWFHISGKAEINDYKPAPTDVIKVYFWNLSPGEVYIDDVLLVLGKLQLKGNTPLLDLTRENYKFSSKPNQPPYQSIFAQKVLAVNSKNTSILSPDGLSSLELLANDKFMTGHFLKGFKTEQMLLIRNELPFAIIWFEAGENEFRFETLDQSLFPAVLKMQCLLPADVNGDAADELIFITGDPQMINVYAFNLAGKKAELLSEGRSKVDKGIMQVQKFRIEGKRNESLFVTNDKGEAFLLTFEKKQWNIQFLGYIPEASSVNFDSRIVSGHFITSGGNDNILLLHRDRKSNKCFYKMFSVDPLHHKISCLWQNDFKGLQQGSFDNACDTLYPENTYFAADINGDGISELISYDGSWRFDMKLIRFTEKSYQIVGNIDFKGYESDHNPKYYEDLAIATGNFTGQGPVSVFTFCKNHKPITDLPENIGIYSLPIMEKEVAK